MNREIATRLAKWLVGLFPGTTKEQAQEFRDIVLAHNWNEKDVEAAVRTHWAAKEKSADGSNFCNFPDLFGGINTLASQRTRHQQKRASQRVIDWLRETQPATCMGLTDVEAIIGHFTGAWQAVSSPDNPHPSTEYGRQWTRRYIWGVCTGALVECGIDRASAESFARACVGMEDGERFNLPQVHFEIAQEAVNA